MANKINFIDCSLRDGHQSLLATRMSTEQCMRVLPMLKDSGYDILELWGGATLDSAIRFTNDDPWIRLEKFRKCLGPDIQIRSLCRGQNLFGYSPYADKVVFEFIKEAVRTGNNRIRTFDALNDPRNLQQALMATKMFGGHAEAALSYTTSPVHNIQYFIAFAQGMVDDGCDSIAIKDMAGLLHPADCFALVEGIRRACGNIPITLHSHDTNGLAIASYIAGMLAGVNHLDTDHGPMAGATSQPPIELMLWFAREAGFETNVKTDHFDKIDKELRTIRTELKEFDANPMLAGHIWPKDPPKEIRPLITQALKLIETRDRAKIEDAIAIIEDQIMVGQGYPKVDRTQLDAQVPGGMISNLHNQLKAMGKLENMARILDEIPRVRQDAGFVPLVTPTSQIVGVQATFNVNAGARYAIITKEFRDLMLGKYGRLPGPANQEVVKRCAVDGGEVLTKRPGLYAEEPDMPKILAEAGNLIQSKKDLLLYVLFAQPAKALFEKRKLNQVKL